MMNSKPKRPTLHLPHERDEISDAQPVQPRPKMKQAYNDLQRGLVDTDMHGARGIEAAVSVRTKIFRGVPFRK